MPPHILPLLLLARGRYGVKYGSLQGERMKSRIVTFFRIDSESDELVWAGAIIVLLYVVQLISDGSVHP